MKTRRENAQMLACLLCGQAMLGALVLSEGCAVGPNFNRPTVPSGSYSPKPLPGQTSSSEVSIGAAQALVPEIDISAKWWELFQSESLNQIIAKSLRANPQVQAAQAALRAARATTLAQKGAYYPNIQAGASVTRSKTAGTLSPTTFSGALSYDLYNAQVSVSYVPDVFGLNRRTVESLKAQEEAQRFQLEATYLTLSANVVTAVVQDASLRAQIEATEEVIKLETEQLGIMKRQQEFGSIAGTDVLSQETALAQSRQLLPPLQKQLAQNRDLMAVLVGEMPSAQPTEQFDLTSLSLPRELPVSLPARLVDQRPDVRMAEASLHAASAQIGIAIANRLPNITLTATKGSAALAAAELFSSGTGFWSVGAALLQPVFDGGTLHYRQKAAQASYDQASAQYRYTVLTAFQNVADTLNALQTDADAVKAAFAAEQAAAKNLAITRQQLNLGAIAYLSLLNAQQAYQQTKLSLVQAQASRLSDTAALFQALGGGWWNRPLDK